MAAPMSDAEIGDLLGRKVSVPEHVAIREFSGESVALNITSGRYFGLNTVAARMLDELRGAERAVDCVETLAQDYEQRPETIRRDLAELIGELAERDLIVLESV